MKLIVVVLMLLLLSLSVPSEAQTWNGVFVAVQGTRVDYFPDKRGFQSQEDAVSHWRFEFRIPAEGSKAQVRLIPEKNENKPSEDYEAVVISRNDDMIALALRYSINPKPEKTEIYTLYPKLGIGFLTDTSAFLGNWLMKDLATFGDPNIPHASAKIIPLRRIDQ